MAITPAKMMSTFFAALVKHQQLLHSFAQSFGNIRYPIAAVMLLTQEAVDKQPG